ncbi:MAG: tetratricopeptide repeat protein [Planctomycetaceae bacterium]|nr:tetratricopeptide repeat protein [Planctomycetaceae bacterium]
MTSDSCETLFEIGLNLLAQDQFGEAAEQFSRILSVEPDNIEALRKRSQAFFYDAEFEKALADLNTAIAIAPDQPNLYIDRANMQIILDETADIREDAETALKLDPNDSAAYVTLANYWNVHFDLEKMAEMINLALQIDPNDFAALNYQSYIFNYKSQSKESEQCLNRACEILEKKLTKENRDYDSLIFYKIISFSKNNFELALDIGNEIIRRFPKLPFTYVNRGQTFAQLNDFSDAQSDFETAEKMFDQLEIKDSRLYCGQAEMLLRQGEPNRVCELLEQVFGRIPDNPAALIYWLDAAQAIIAAEEKSIDIDKTIDKANHLCQLVPNYYHAFLLRSLFLAQKNDWHASDDDFEWAIDLLPKTTEYQFIAAAIAYNTGRYTTVHKRYMPARDLFNDILQREPDNIDALVWRGMTWTSLGIYDCAVKDFSRALELKGVDADILIRRASALLGLGNCSFTCSYYRKAIADFTLAIEINPKDSKHWFERGVAWFLVARKAWFGTKKSLQNSIDDYSEAIRLDSKNADIWYNRALSYWFLLNIDAVIDDCSAALRFNTNHIDARELRAQAYRRCGEIKKSAEDYLFIEQMDNRNH